MRVTDYTEGLIYDMPDPSDDDELERRDEMEQNFKYLMMLKDCFEQNGIAISPIGNPELIRVSEVLGWVIDYVKRSEKNKWIGFKDEVF